MCVAVFCSQQDAPLLADLLSQQSLSAQSCRQVFCHDYDHFMEVLVEENADLILVNAAGAAGMEAVYAAKNTHPEAPVIWFSDDKDFGAQSYRLGCAYFSARPITPELLARSIRCAKLG